MLFTILASFTGALWFSVIIFGVASIAYATTLRRKIAVAIQRGEHIRARLTYHEDDRLEEYDRRVAQWEREVQATMNKTDYELRWMDEAGLPKRDRIPPGPVNEKHLKILQQNIDANLKQLDWVFKDLKQT
ncbi:MAG: hypothetical protein IIC20_00435 [Chloroflexi bacterium]|nr:hypothetical protein [Chloroflexota bacterium]